MSQMPWFTLQDAHRMSTGLASSELKPLSSKSWSGCPRCHGSLCRMPTECQPVLQAQSSNRFLQSHGLDVPDAMVHSAGCPQNVNRSCKLRAQTAFFKVMVWMSQMPWFTLQDAHRMSTGLASSELK